MKKMNSRTNQALVTGMFGVAYIINMRSVNRWFTKWSIEIYDDRLEIRSPNFQSLLMIHMTQIFDIKNLNFIYSFYSIIEHILTIYGKLPYMAQENNYLALINKK